MMKLAFLIIFLSLSNISVAMEENKAITGSLTIDNQTHKALHAQLRIQGNYENCEELLLQPGINKKAIHINVMAAPENFIATVWILNGALVDSSKKDIFFKEEIDEGINKSILLEWWLNKVNDNNQTEYFSSYTCKMDKKRSTRLINQKESKIGQDLRYFAVTLVLKGHNCENPDFEFDAA